MKVTNKFRIFTVLFLLFILSSPSFAQTAVESGGELESIIKVMVAVTAFLVAVIMWLVLVYSEKK